jgi:hypothetical protein
MFGHQNNSDQTNAGQTAGPADDISLSAHTPETIAPTPATSAPTVADSVGDYEVTDLPHIPVTSIPAATPLPGHGNHIAAATPVASPAAAPPITSNDANDLIDLKQSALQELSPLIGHLEQTPEEKFRTTMMMIQASDDQTMLQTAFEAAKEIKDEKTRAQALLDVVNEINYFTQHNDTNQ